MNKNIDEFNKTELELINSYKLTENGDDATNTTGNKLADILFMSQYYRNHLNEVSIGDSAFEKMFSRFIRDPRFGIGERDLGRKLMDLSGTSIEDMIVSGRFDDVLHYASLKPRAERNVIYSAVFEIAKGGNELAKKWMPRLSGRATDRAMALDIIDATGVTNKEYRQAISVDTVERKLSEGRISEINFSHVPSLAMIKYYGAFKRNDGERFNEYLESVTKGEEKINVATTTVYDIYKARENINADLFINQLDIKPMSVLPVIDSSASMRDHHDSFGKAMSVGHYLAKASSYAKNTAISFSARPTLLHFTDEMSYLEQIRSFYTGDCSVTNIARVFDILSLMDSFPDYIVVLSDMEFDGGGRQSKENLRAVTEAHGAQTKLVWWNFNTRNTTSPELDEDGNIFMSGYSPQLLQYLESGFDNNDFMQKLVLDYALKVTGSND